MNIFGHGHQGFLRITTLLILLLSHHPAWSFSLETRQSSLYSHDGAHLLGTILERKTTDNTHEVWIGQTQQDLEEDPDSCRKVSIPYVAQADSVGSSLWPPCLAGAILLNFCDPSITNEKSVLELGCGLGLGGLTASKNAAKCTLSDHGEELVKLLDKHLLETDNVNALRLDWRDADPTQSLAEYDVCLGFDVAYYYPFIAPFVNAVRQQRKTEKSLLFVVGQAHRESHWLLYHHIKDGGYNQITDEREEPWEGTTRMLLYKLEMGMWKKEGEEAQIEGVLPMAALLHTTDDLQVEPFSAHDHVATQEDEDAQMLSF